ncbi:MAG: copper transporter family protein [Oscillospiraceae bacterium]|nr:copper transporter family protein [Oscillospiraceae bacterium]
MAVVKGKKKIGPGRVIGWIFKTVAYLYMFGVLVMVFFPSYVNDMDIEGDSMAPMLDFLFRSLWQYILILIAAVLLYRWLRAVVKRARLTRRIRKVCTEKGYALHIRRHPCLALPFRSRRPELIITAEDRLYAVLFFPVFNRRTAIHFAHPDTVILIKRILRQGMDIRRKIRFRFKMPALPAGTPDYPIEKILIIHPICYRLTTSVGGESTEADNGDKLFGCTLYAGTAFCNTLRRRREGDEW